MSYQERHPINVTRFSTNLSVGFRFNLLFDFIENTFKNSVQENQHQKMISHTPSFLHTLVYQFFYRPSVCNISSLSREVENESSQHFFNNRRQAL